MHEEPPERMGRLDTAALASATADFKAAMAVESPPQGSVLTDEWRRTFLQMLDDHEGRYSANEWVALFRRIKPEDYAKALYAGVDDRGVPRGSFIIARHNKLSPLQSIVKHDRVDVLKILVEQFGLVPTVELRNLHLRTGTTQHESLLRAAVANNAPGCAVYLDALGVRIPSVELKGAVEELRTKPQEREIRSIDAIQDFLSRYLNRELHALEGVGRFSVIPRPPRPDGFRTYTGVPLQQHELLPHERRIRAAGQRQIFTKQDPIVISDDDEDDETV